ncbi:MULTISPECIES: hypothetical protein [Hwangdonia]|uniref:Co-chaperone DjlA N-terminal domain-containing protein n=1 Tax=Hwangdonia seohaensis TaxID=1240727 RepID=A0ABW3RFL1_9FLAO|nr:hypothetical protein [Hwangdonia seohaensis]
METKKKTFINFYQNLGKLFYAIAAADKKVEDAEYDTLKELVKKHWLNVDVTKDANQTDAAYQIDIVFDWLNNENKLDAKACFNDFIAYKNEQKHLFTNKVKRLILKTASEIAHAFSGINKSELILLAKLDIELRT